MKIVWVSHDANLSAGAELCLLEGVQGLVARGHQLHVVVPARGRLSERLGEVQVSTLVIPYRWWMHYHYRLPFKRLCQNWLAAKKLAEFLRQSRPDVVISNTLTVPVGAFASRWAGIPHVWYIHEFGLEDHGLRFDLGSSLSLFLIDRLSSRILVNSKAVFDRFRVHVPEYKLRQVYYAVESPARRRASVEEGGSFRLILVGRICAGKRQEDAVRAVALLAERGLKVRLSLVGNENVEYGRFLRKLASENGIEKDVEFVAFTEDPFSHFARCQLALVCSKFEAFGRVTVEAMKLGKAVVGADSGATSELIQNGATGLLYRPGDAKDLAQKIESLVNDRALLDEMGKTAEIWARRTFNLDNYTSDLLRILGEAAADGKDRLRKNK